MKCPIEGLVRSGAGLPRKVAIAACFLLLHGTNAPCRAQDILPAPAGYDDELNSYNVIWDSPILQYKNVINYLPPDSCDLVLKSPVEDWWEALPLGNGQLGALVWGKGNRLTVKLDRVDVWDERVGHPAWKTDEFTWKTLQQYLKEGDSKEKRYKEIFQHPYFNNPPTHVAMGKLELTLPDGAVAKTFTLDLAEAEARIDYIYGNNVRAFVSATQPVIMMCIPGELKNYEIWAPGMNNTWVSFLGYPSPILGRDEDSCWYTQSIPEGPALVVLAKRKVTDGNTHIAITVTSSETDGQDPLKAARACVDKALEEGYHALFASHAKYWKGFWETSALRIPNQRMLQHYYLTRYFFGSNSRPGFPAMGTLQGIWTDNRQYPAFKNNLHNDLETQVQYQAYQTAGNFAEGAAFLEYLWERLPAFRRFARSFYEADGAAVPGCMTWGGRPTTGWPQYALSPTQAGWFGWLFYQHWRYTQDRNFLKKRAYPWCVEIAECWNDLLEPDDNGILKLPLSASPEIFNDSRRAWLKPNSNYDLDMMQVHLLGLSEMARELDKRDEAARWTKIAASLGSRHVDDENALMWSENEKVTKLHRHFSHSMSIHPFNLLTIAGSDRDRAIITGTMKRYDQLSLARNFKWDWAGWSFPWMSSTRARVGDAEQAYNHLNFFLDGFITRNGFNLNQNKGKTEAYHKDISYFTIEGNMLANQAVHDMLIQSWAPGIGESKPGIIRIFPAVPKEWREVQFQDLRAEGGFKVSAIRKEGKTSLVRIEATADSLLQLLDPFQGQSVTWKSIEPEKNGNCYECLMKKGDILEAVTGHDPAVDK